MRAYDQPVAQPARNDRRRMPERERRSLFPHEARDMRRPSPEDAGHWVDVYLEMLALFQRILASAPADQRQLLTAEVERIGGRIDYWRGFAQS